MVKYTPCWLAGWQAVWQDKSPQCPHGLPAFHPGNMSVTQCYSCICFIRHYLLVPGNWDAMFSLHKNNCIIVCTLLKQGKQVVSKSYKSLFFICWLVLVRLANIRFSQHQNIPKTVCLRHNFGAKWTIIYQPQWLGLSVNVFGFFLVFLWHDSEIKFMVDVSRVTGDWLHIEWVGLQVFM